MECSECPSERDTHRVITSQDHSLGKCVPLSFSYMISRIAVQSFSAQASQSQRWPNYL